MIHAVSSTDVLEIEKKRRLSGSGTTMTTGGSCGYLASLGGSGSGSGDEGDSMEISPSAATGPSRPVIKRSSSLGHSSTFLIDGSAGDDENAVPQTTSTDVESSDDEQQTRAEARRACSESLDSDGPTAPATSLMSAEGEIRMLLFLLLL